MERLHQAEVSKATDLNVENSDLQGPPPTLLPSDVLADSAAEREEILKRLHKGSAGHPHMCKPCKFPGDLCWKGLSCPFCHLCATPKRKSKRARVEHEFGPDRLKELTEIKELLASTNELKGILKRAFKASGVNRHQLLGNVKTIVLQMQRAIDGYDEMCPDFDVEERRSNAELMVNAASAINDATLGDLHPQIRGPSALEDAKADISTDDGSQLPAFPSQG